jgi:hypothetical protein
LTFSYNILFGEKTFTSWSKSCKKLKLLLLPKFHLLNLVANLQALVWEIGVAFG